MMRDRASEFAGVTGGRSYKHRSKDQVIEIDWSWFICWPVGKGRFDERLRDKENVSEHFVVLWEIFPVCWF